MFATRGYATDSPGSPFRPFDIERRAPGPDDVAIEIHYCGICHSDIHQAREEWGPASFPMVPGHEIVGRVTAVGDRVREFRVGDRVGIGCFVDSCRNCGACTDGAEQYCQEHLSFTYNSTEQDRKTPTYGGYSGLIVVDRRYVLKVPESIDPAAAAPLLCAGVTTWGPLRSHRVGPGTRVGIMGFGGLGHMGIRLALAMGAEVTVLSSSPAKEADARRLGAHDFRITSTRANRVALGGRFDLVIDTVSGAHDVEPVIDMLGRNGTLVVVGIPSEPFRISAMPLVANRRSVSGSMIGGIRETQEMLDYCGEHNITSEVEVISVHQIDEAWDRAVRGDVRYRFVIDMATLYS